MKATIKTIVNAMGFDLVRLPITVDTLITKYRDAGGRPWSAGYKEYKERYIADVLADREQMKRFKNDGLLEADYGVALDERCVEYPWYLSHSDKNASYILDAGSALNHEYIVNSSYLSDKKLTILTLAPEGNCFWRQGVSYEYAEMQNMPFRENLFDEVVCISTLEHVGMDNEIYTKAKSAVRDHAAYEQAVLDMKRVLKPGGKLFISVPFGKYQDWGMFQQFDQNMLDRIVEIFSPAKFNTSVFAYTDSGWQRSDIEACSNTEFSEFALAVWNGEAESVKLEPDRAAAARAVACLELVKGA